MVKKVKKERDALEMAKKMRSEMIKRYVKRDGGFQGVTCAGVITDKGHSFHDDGLACHAFLQRGVCTDLDGNRKYIVTLNQRAKFSGHDYEDLKLYYDFLCNHSPMSGDCVTTDPIEAIEEGMIVATETVGFNVTQVLMIASRSPWEYGNPLVPFFAALVRKGVPQRLAFLIATCAQSRGENASLDRTGWGHFPLDQEHMGVDQWRNFIEGKIHNENEPYIRNSSYNGAHKVWDWCREDNNMMNKLPELMELVDVPAGWGDHKAKGFDLKQMDKVIESFDMEMFCELGMLDIL